MQYFDVLYVSRRVRDGYKVRYGVLTVQAPSAINARVYACSVLSERGRVMVDGHLCHLDTVEAAACGNFDSLHGKEAKEVFWL